MNFVNNFKVNYLLRFSITTQTLTGAQLKSKRLIVSNTYFNLSAFDS
jgi:hypothetical protein